MAKEIEINFEEEHVLNSRGMKLLASKWIPMNSGPPKAIILMCHGYAMECSITMDSTARRLAKGGYAVYGIDYEGHGKSDGKLGLVMNMDDVIDDCLQHFTKICEMEENKKMTRYLLGESMGGAIALLLHRKKPHYWDGAILVAPMCKIADDIKPSAVVVGLLSVISKVAPTLQVISTSSDIIDLAFKVPQVREQIRANEYCYKGKPMLRTGYELNRVSTEIEQRLNEVSLPFIVLHGEEDRVTDLSVSKQLYNVASSSDKTLRVYPGMWHGLLYGEPPENLDIVFSDIFNWIEERCEYGNKRLERELKQQNEDDCPKHSN